MSAFVRAQDVAAFMGRPNDTALLNLLAEHIRVVSEIVNAYVRGHGVTRVNGMLYFPPDLEAVVITATARLANNPVQLDSEGSDGYTASGAFTGFNLGERAILHRYRRRAA